jgi:hypothetical protein
MFRWERSSQETAVDITFGQLETIAAALEIFSGPTLSVEYSIIPGTNEFGDEIKKIQKKVIIIEEEGTLHQKHLLFTPPETFIDAIECLPYHRAQLTFHEFTEDAKPEYEEHTFLSLSPVGEYRYLLTQVDVEPSQNPEGEKVVKRSKVEVDMASKEADDQVLTREFWDIFNSLYKELYSVLICFVSLAEYSETDGEYAFKTEDAELNDFLQETYGQILPLLFDAGRSIARELYKSGSPSWGSWEAKLDTDEGVVINGSHIVFNSKEQVSVVQYQALLDEATVLRWIAKCFSERRGERHALPVIKVPVRLAEQKKLVSELLTGSFRYFISSEFLANKIEEALYGEDKRNIHHKVTTLRSIDELRDVHHEFAKLSTRLKNKRTGFEQVVDTVTNDEAPLFQLAFSELLAMRLL